MKKTTLLALLALSACQNDGDVVSKNISTDAANFKVHRRIVFYNGITNDYILTIEGLCTIDTSVGRELSVTCRTGSAAYKKHFLVLSNNVTFFAEQVEESPASAYFYRVVFKPSVVVPAVELR